MLYHFLSFVYNYDYLIFSVFFGFLFTSLIFFKVINKNFYRILFFIFFIFLVTGSHILLGNIRVNKEFVDSLPSSQKNINIEYYNKYKKYIKIRDIKFEKDLAKGKYFTIKKELKTSKK